MPSSASDIHRPYIAGELQWPIQRDTSVCWLFRGLGRSRSGQNPLSAVAKQATEGIVDVPEQPTGSTLKPKVLLGKNARPAAIRAAQILLL
jgi:hypothetical protein